MSPTVPTPSRRPLRRLVHRSVHRSVAVATAAALALSLAALSGTASDDARLVAGGRTSDEQPAPATVFQISSFNVLGAGHTQGSGGRASGWKRQGWADQLLVDHGVDVVGFQELQGVQLDRFEQDLGDQFDVFPGKTMSSAAMQNSIAWRTADWSLVEARTVKVPYFDGNLIAKPYVLLRNTQTDQLIWVYNTHHPADAHGEAQRWRDKATEIELKVFNGLAEEFPGVPVFATGDMNDREEVFCPFVRGSDLRAANGGGILDDRCVPPGDMKVDWVFGSSMVAFTSYQALRDELVQKTTDHPMINTTASIPPAWAQDLPVKRVLVLEVDGLRSDAIETLGASGAPNLQALMAQGSSSLNARTSYELTTTLPNVASILTGRRVVPEDGGHGVMANDEPDTTVHTLAGRYVSSVFDLVHNRGRSTALYTSDARLALFDRSWDAEHGGTDRYGLDDGPDKIDDYVEATSDGQLVRRLRAALASAPRTFTLAHLTEVGRAGREHRFMSQAYLDAVRTLDTRVGRVVRTIDSTPALADSTLLVLTAANGGRRHRQTARNALATYRVPFVVRGPGVLAGTDLYAINPAFPDPGTARPTYDGAQPVRNGMVANLALAALGLPAVPGRTMNAEQSFSAFR